MRLSEAQRTLLGEIADGSARYVSSRSIYWRTVEVLKREGLVKTKFEGYYGGGPDTEVTLTEKGRLLVEES